MNVVIKQRSSLYLYLLAGLLYGICLGFGSTYVTTIASVFFGFFVILEDGQHYFRLAGYSALFSLVFLCVFLWPLGPQGLGISPFDLSLLAVFTALSLLGAYHKANSLTPPYILFFDEAWNNFIIIVSVLLFSLVVQFFIYLACSLFLFIGISGLKLFFAQGFVSRFVLGFFGVFGVFLVKVFPGFRYYFRFLLIFLGRFFFVVLTVIAVLFFASWAVKGFSTEHFQLGSIAFTHLLTWFAIAGLLLLNMAYPYEVREGKFTVLRRYSIVVYIVLGFLLITLANVTYFQFAKAQLGLVNFYDYFVNAFLWMYYAAYLLALLLNRQSFLRKAFPRVNIYLAWVFVASMFLFNNPLTHYFIHR